MHHALELPWATADKLKEKYPLRMVKGGIAFYTGPLLPAELRPYSCEDFSLGRWIEDERNATVMPPEKEVRGLSLMPHQVEAQLAITAAYDRGSAGFLLADKTGLGKTLSSLAGITGIAQQEGFGERERAKVLIVSQRSSVASWQKAIQQYPLSTMLCRFMVIPYAKMNSLLMAPPQARLASKGSTKNREKARHGVPTIDWNFIIFDSTHMLQGYPRSVPALEATAIAKLNKNYTKSKSPFVIYNTAAPGASPLDFAIMAPIIAPLLGEEEHVGPERWADFLKSKGFSITEGRNGPLWAHYSQAGKNTSGASHGKYLAEVELAARARKRDSVTLARSLQIAAAPFLMRKPEHTQIPTVHFTPVALSMPGPAKIGYSAAWENFRTWMNRNPRGNDNYTAKLNEFLTASSRTRTPELVDMIITKAAEGDRVYVRCISAGEVEGFAEKIQSKGIPTASILSSQPNSHLKEWDSFQTGEARVILTDTAPSLGNLFNPFEGPVVNFLASSPVLYRDLRNDVAALTKEGQRAICAVPYYPKTLESLVAQEIIEESLGGESLMVEIDETFYRRRAARTIPANRLS